MRSAFFFLLRNSKRVLYHHLSRPFQQHLDLLIRFLLYARCGSSTSCGAIDEKNIALSILSVDSSFASFRENHRERTRFGALQNCRLSLSLLENASTIFARQEKKTKTFRLHLFRVEHFLVFRRLDRLGK